MPSRLQTGRCSAVIISYLQITWILCHARPIAKRMVWYNKHLFANDTDHTPWPLASLLHDYDDDFGVSMMTEMVVKS